MNQRTTQLISGWRMLLPSGSGTDNSGSQVTNPLLSAQVSSAAWALCDNSSGRLLRVEPELSSGSLLVLPFSTSSTGTLEFTLWRVHPASSDTKGGSIPAYRIGADANAFNVGPCENACRDSGVDSIIAAVTANRQLLKINRAPAVDAVAASQDIDAYIGNPYIFNLHGAMGIFPTVKSRTNASGLLAKFI